MKKSIITNLITTLILFISTLNFGQKIDSISVYYKTGNHTLNTTNKEKITTFLNFYSTNTTSYSIQVKAQTDKKGSLKSNQKLAIKRGQNIVNFITQKGFKNFQFNTQFIGEKEAKGEENNQKFRRTDIIINRKYALPKGLKNIKEVTQKFTILPNETQKITSTSGTEFTVKANSFVDKMGNEVKGKVNISLTEYRDPADFITGGIPMDIHENGEHGHFNSAGMFDINARTNGENIYLKKGKNIDVNFKLTQNIPGLNLYNFDTINQKWNTLQPINTTQQNPNTNWTNLSECSSCKHYLQSINIGDKIAQNGMKISTILDNYDIKLDSLRNEENKYGIVLDLELKHHHEIDSVYNEIEESKSTYQIEPIKVKKNYTTFKINSSNENTSALKNFKNVIWKKENILPKDTLNSKKWNSVNFKQSPNSEEVKLVFKGLGGSTEFDAIPNYKERMKNKNAFSHTAQKIRQYNINVNTINDSLKSAKETQSEPYRKKKTAATKKLIESQKIKLPLREFIELYTPKNMTCFFENGVLLGAKEELTMSQDNWFDYFDSTSTQMKIRYSALKNNNKRYKECASARENQIRQQQLVAANKRKISEQFNRLKTTFSISKMGVYNCDQLYKLQNAYEITAEYIDEKGNKILPIMIYLVDKSLNGIIRYDGYMGLNPYKFKVTELSSSIIAYDAGGNSYLITKKELTKSNTNKKQFNVKSMDYIKSKEQLKGVL